MRVAFLTTQFPPDYQFGGPVRSAGGLVTGLLRAGAEVKVVTTSPAADGPVALDWNGTAEELSRFTGRRARSFLSHRWAFAPRFPSLCVAALKDADVAYINGIGTFPNTIASYLCRSRGIPFVEAVRGGFEPDAVKYHRLRKMMYFRLVTLPLLSRAAAVHATTEVEAESCRAMGVRNRIVVIPNGIFPEEYESISDLSSLDKFESLLRGRKFVLYASRLSWEKGLDVLAQAWEQVRRRHKDHCLLIAGSADRPHYEKTARGFFGEEIGKSVHFLGRVPGENLRVLYAAAEVFVLPSYSENFGNVVVEAMASGTPVVTTTGTPWKVVEEKNLGRWVEPTAESIAGALDEMLSMGSPALKEIGQRAREFALREYSWYHIGREMYAVLREVAGM